jgi:hypothetical protein
MKRRPAHGHDAQRRSVVAPANGGRQLEDPREHRRHDNERVDTIASDGGKQSLWIEAPPEDKGRGRRARRRTAAVRGSSHLRGTRRRGSAPAGARAGAPRAAAAPRGPCSGAARRHRASTPPESPRRSPRGSGTASRREHRARRRPAAARGRARSYAGAPRRTSALRGRRPGPVHPDAASPRSCSLQPASRPTAEAPTQHARADSCTPSRKSGSAPPSATLPRTPPGAP